ncbi:type II secretion system protein [Planococcus halotolerans]|uniref:Type II secretion system protein n=1 Tax=Planococcus halotolerans TaxID=2233542 RepID=A0A365KM18_9BACL|nr:type II secretion system protein [Planococcus halotolerans]QHJ71661.1 type II secretion system protein [Planococcus halotolerans]RAZ74123.1 type II secretion system protein [Planococcus halotolerans]
MKNEKGITLVELIAVLAVAGITVALIASVLSSGTNASQRTSMNQQLQQEGNIIVEKIRAQYLLNQKEDTVPDKFEIVVENDKLIFKDDTGTNMVISEGFKYDLDPASADNTSPTKKKVVLDRTQKSVFNLLIRGKTNGNSPNQEYKINTSFSKLN